MKILKFGGTSVGSPERIEQVAAIIKESQSENGQIAVVLSAFGGITDQLVETGKQAANGDDGYLLTLQEIFNKHTTFTSELLSENNEAALQAVKKNLHELKDVLQGVFLLKELTVRSLDFIMSFGERLSNFIVSERLKKDGVKAAFLDARKVVRTDENFGSARVDFDITNRNIQEYFSGNNHLHLITGFIGTTANNVTTTLGRGGSDYTASIFAAALEAAEIEIWTDVDGVMTADPRKVPRSFSVDHLSYEEAMEMSHFGAKVIHPPTMQPALCKNIPIRIRNTFNPAFPGTTIGNGKPKNENNGNGYLIKGVTSIPNVALLRVEGSGMIGVAGTARRIFDALGRNGINIILITQASSEHSICFAVAPHDAANACQSIESEFTLEIDAGHIEKPYAETDLAIVAIVGDNMHHTPGIAGRLFRALGRNGINVSAIAQGSSELNISVVIPTIDETKALNAIHESFFLSDVKTLNLFLAGPGLIGGTLMKQLESHYDFLSKERSLQINVIGMINRKKMILSDDGIGLAGWQQAIENAAEESDLTAYVDRMKVMNLPNSVFVDCTADDGIVQLYDDILAANISVVTPNKKAAAGPYSLYQRLTRTAARSGAKFLFETNVGAGLPVISTLRDLHGSGDEIVKIEAVLSGTLSYIFNTFDGRTAFSDVVSIAREKGYTEPDPRDDLNGLDVARKLLILARETGLKLEIEDITLENLVPEDCRDTASVETFFEKLKQHDDVFAKRCQDAATAGEVLRYIAVLENGKAEVALKSVGPEHPFYHLSGSDNMISFTSDRYNDRPLVIKGPGAGAEVTAAGVFADIIRIVN